MAMEPKGAEILPKPLPQIMPRNLTDAMKPPLGAAQVAPPEKLVNMDVCRGYYDVMGQYDLTFNCSKGTFIYCCGTCHYRFCCEHSRNRLDQDSCTNYNTPDWANTHVSTTPPPGWGPGPTFDPVRTQSNTAYVIGGVLSFTLAAAVGMKVVFHKMSRRPHNREINMPRALVDILRHQSSPVQQGERNNSTILTTATSGEGKLGRPPKKLYTPVLPSKDNRLGNVQHNLGGLSGSSPKHTATIERAPRMNNVQLAPTGTLLSSKHGSMGRPPSSLSHSFHNLAQLPPSYDVAMRPDISRYCSLKRLEKDLEDYSTMGYSTSKRRPNNMPPSFHSSQHHLHWGGDYTLGARGTLPLHSSRSRIHLPATPNPYPLPPSQSAYHPGMEPLSHPPPGHVPGPAADAGGGQHALPPVQEPAAPILQSHDHQQELHRQHTAPVSRAAPGVARPVGRAGQDADGFRHAADLAASHQPPEGPVAAKRVRHAVHGPPPHDQDELPPVVWPRYGAQPPHGGNHGLGREWTRL
ncbi:hypothetical protein AALO_G00253960 [Alosa alosa]|uniref:Shisa N-terminal domain-containing protein n=1 Tax=Alosa alosa TaxID=278164 RepID=A0AAV6FTB4_9TELE|nr:hypothetical protein AALO_G00253960 [Alosa alosa]